MSVSDIIQAKLKQALDPIELELEDDSAKHKGHQGYKPGGESHFNLYIVAGAFSGLNRVKRHQLIYDTLKDELKEQVHALSIKAFAPSEV